MSDRDVKQRRRYDNSGRAEQARATRRRIVAAAHAVLVARGYGATTVASVAEAAGVSVETIYKNFGSKRVLVREVLDVAIAGDDEPVAMADRPEAHAIAAEPTGAGLLRRYARHVRALYARLGPLPGILLSGARSGEAELREFGEEADRQRLAGAAITAGRLAATGDLRPDVDQDHARDVIWTLNSPDVHRLCTADRGWSDDEYEEFLAATLIGALLRPGAAGA